MQAEHQMRPQPRTTRPTVEGTATRDELLVLPGWESFSQEDPHHVVSLTLQTARRQLTARPPDTTPSR